LFTGNSNLLASKTPPLSITQGQKTSNVVTVDGWADFVLEKDARLEGLER
jgi:hypothetical protein